MLLYGFLYFSDGCGLIFRGSSGSVEGFTKLEIPPRVALWLYRLVWLGETLRHVLQGGIIHLRLWRGRLYHRCNPAGVVSLGAPLSGLLSQLDFDFRPLFLPAIRANHIAKCQHRVDMSFCPVHSCPFQAGFDHQFVPTFHNPTSNRPALGLKVGILHLRSAFFQVSQIAGDGILLGVGLLELLEFQEQFVGAFMFQAMQTITQPGSAFCRMLAIQRASPIWFTCSAAWGKSRMRTAAGQ
jgi:hypothetical protein